MITKIAQAGISCHAVVHDAFLVSDSVDQIEVTVAKTRLCMAEASQIVLGGHALKTDAKTFSHPQRFQENRGIEVWEMLQGDLKRNPQDFRLT